MILTATSSLAEAIFSDLSLIPVVNRFGISLGIGDFSVDEICRKHNIDTSFFLAMVNTFLNENYFPSESEVAFPVESVLDFLSLTDEYYSEVQLPNITRHFRSLLAHSQGKNNLPQLSRFFDETSRELLACIEADRVRFFPLVRQLRAGEFTLNQTEGLPFALSRRGVADKVTDLASFFVMHLRGEYDRNLCFAVLSAIFQLARDIDQNNRIRERILCPVVTSLITHISTSASNYKSLANSQSQVSSQSQSATQSASKPQSHRNG